VLFISILWGRHGAIRRCVDVAQEAVVNQRIALFKEYLHQPSQDARVSFAIEHPVLFSEDLLDEVLTYAAHLPTAESPSLQEGVAQLAAGLEYFLEHPASYPIGIGPIEAIFARMESGAIALDQALIEARLPPVTSLLSACYVHALGIHAF